MIVQQATVPARGSVGKPGKVGCMMRSFMQEWDFPEEQPGKRKANDSRWGGGAGSLKLFLLPEAVAFAIPPLGQPCTDRQVGGSVPGADAVFCCRRCSRGLSAIPHVHHQLLQFSNTRTRQMRGQNPALRADLIHLLDHPKRSVPGTNGSSPAGRRNIRSYELTPRPAEGLEIVCRTVYNSAGENLSGPRRG
jgi:hypothetical protein